MTASTSFSIRKATPEDAAAIGRLGASTFAATFGHSVTPEQLASHLEEGYSVEATTSLIVDDDRDMFLAVSAEDRIMGFALLTRGSVEPELNKVLSQEQLIKTIELQRIYVDPESQGSGVGKALERKLVETAREEGYEYMWLSVWDQHTKGHRVYERMGYEAVGKKTFDVGGDVQGDLLMLKKL